MDVSQYIRERMRKNATAAGEYLVQKVQEKIAVLNPDGKSPSAPGEPPRLVTGNLQESIGYTATSDGVSVYASAEHGEILEFGGSRVEARPFLRPTMIEEAGAVARILAS